jgi:hypothetical protein
MPSISVKNIPPELYDRLKQAAAANRRSLNSEIITLIEQGLSRSPIDPEAVLAPGSWAGAPAAIPLPAWSLTPRNAQGVRDRRAYEPDRVPVSGVRANPAG